MGRARLLVEAMAESCQEVIEAGPHTAAARLPPALQPTHLLEMCQRIREHADDWPQERLHRWLGFVQAGMMANGLLDLAGAKHLFDRAKTAFGKTSVNLFDHLDPGNGFELDLGGEG